MLTGTCHCTAASWTLTTAPKSATACNCTICRKYGTLWAYGWADEDISLRGPTTSYTRSDGGALEFHFCPTCGNCLAWRMAEPDPGGRVQTAVNLRLAEDPAALMDIPVRHFDGLDTFAAVEGNANTVRELWF